ncbi:MAG: FHA domain-containing protein [Curtobacterium sp.]
MRNDDTADGSRDDDGGTEHADDVADTVIRPRSDGPVAGDDALGDTIVRPRGRRAADPAGDTVIRPRPLGVGDPSDDPLGDTIVRPRRDERERSVALPDEHTIVRRAGAPQAPTDQPDQPVQGVPTRPGTHGGPVAGPAPGLQDGEPRSTRTPSVRIGDHVLRLDRPVVVGRRPALPRIVRGPEPLLVTVRSASGQVSSSHLLVQASGEAAVVEDLRSTNGTVVRPVAGKPFRLASGGSAVVLTGTVVEIGDGNAVEILSPHLRVQPADPVPVPPDRA